MGVPLRQIFSISQYILKMQWRGVKRYPLVLMLEPLFRCNLACPGCGKAHYPEDVLTRRLSAGECLAAADECGAPVVTLAGGEPLIHPEIIRIVDGLLERRKFIYFCTNALLLKKRLHEFEPSPYLTFSIHLDGNRKRHDAAVGREGVFDQAVEAIRTAVGEGFRVTVNCTLFQGQPAGEVAHFLDFAMGLGVEGVTISPAFNYELAPQQNAGMQRAAGRELFREVFRRGRGRYWRLNHSSLYLDFLAGNQAYQCTPWGTPARNVFGWQRPCYLHEGGGHAATFKELMEETNWEAYGAGRAPECAQCMAHCGYEPTAVTDAARHPWKALAAALRGPRVSGPMAPDPADGGR